MSDRRIVRIVVLDEDGEKLGEVRRRADEDWGWRTFTDERGIEGELREAVNDMMTTVQDNLDGVVTSPDDREEDESS